MLLQLCLALFLVSVYAEEKESSTKSKAVPLEKKLDKRGLLNLGYGYGINGLDVGYIGGGYHGGAYHQAAPIIESSPFGQHYGHPIYLGQKTDYHKTVTQYKGYPVPYEVRSQFTKNSINSLSFTTFRTLGHQTRSVRSHKARSISSQGRPSQIENNFRSRSSEFNELI